ncbi:unnamed protein product [Calicophoron daubneyi]|uniref:Leishmanolysin-like peptidase n=1 Tax=Calicophoron daubneyi TaxID=300641 RepID=A0AAV2TST7_CALDB
MKLFACLILEQNRFFAILGCLVVLLLGYNEAETTCSVPTKVNLSFHATTSVLPVAGIVPNTLRITAYYTPAFEALQNAERVKSEIIEPSLDIWRQALVAKNPTGGKYLAKRDCSYADSQLYTDKQGRVHEYCASGCASVTTCYGIEVPNSYLGECRIMKDGSPTITIPAGDGIAETDYLLIVDSSSYQNCKKPTIAFATACQLESVYNRPTLGMLNICPDEIQVEFPLVIRSKSAVIHELAHALGFAPTLYAFMRDENGKPRTRRSPETGMPDLGRNPMSGIFVPSKDTVGVVTRRWKSAETTTEEQVLTLRTPNLLRYARTHFGCPDMDGVDLENQGGTGTASAHFEARLVNDELMSGGIVAEGHLSGLTLSYFKDSGWYEVNMNKAQKWTYGKGLGCDFVKKSCYEYMEIQKSAGKSFAPYCVSKPEEVYCIDYSNAYGSCNLKKYDTELPPKYRYFKSIGDIESSLVPYYAGNSVLMDYCPVLEPYYAVSLTGFCGHNDNNRFISEDQNYHLEAYGDNAACIAHADDWVTYINGENKTLPGYYASCHKYQCSETLGVVITIGNQTYPCSVAGRPIHIETFGYEKQLRGLAVCPPCSTLCENCPGSLKSKATGPTQNLWASKSLPVFIFLYAFILYYVPQILPALA